MWSRSELKGYAKEYLKKVYWKAFAVTLLISVLAGSVGFKSSVNYKVDATKFDQVFDGSGFQRFFSGNIDANQWVDYIPGMTDAWAWIIGVGGVLIIFGILVSILYNALVLNPFIAGSARFFVQGLKDQTGQFDHVVYAFKNGNYTNVVTVMFVRNILVFLATLLLIVPGIVLNFAYFMVPYILADNPAIDSKRALQMSSAMTKGNKFDIFILVISFWGWYILGTLFFGVGRLLIHPYVEATYAQLYVRLRDHAIEEGLLEAEELNLVAI